MHTPRNKCSVDTGVVSSKICLLSGKERTGSGINTSRPARREQSRQRPGGWAVAGAGWTVRRGQRPEAGRAEVGAEAQVLHQVPSARTPARQERKGDSRWWPCCSRAFLGAGAWLLSQDRVPPTPTPPHPAQLLSCSVCSTCGRPFSLPDSLPSRLTHCPCVWVSVGCESRVAPTEFGAEKGQEGAREALEVTEAPAKSSLGRVL